MATQEYVPPLHTHTEGSKHKEQKCDFSILRYCKRCLEIIEYILKYNDGKYVQFVAKH